MSSEAENPPCYMHADRPSTGKLYMKLRGQDDDTAGWYDFCDECLRTDNGSERTPPEPVPEDRLIRSVDLRTDHDSLLSASIRADGALELYGSDVGPFVRSLWGSDEYEYWWRVRKEYKDTVLLWLIKERFASETDFQAWLKEHDIPSSFGSWVSFS